jgi:transglutaminase-like putative cysteine protease
VLARNYGDCKDKAALMRALLKAAGIDSYAVIIYSGDRHFVRPEWPGPDPVAGKRQGDAGDKNF